MAIKIISQIAKKALKSSVIPWRFKLFLLKSGGGQN